MRDEFGELGYLVTEVEDDGPGIVEEDQVNLFKLFDSNSSEVMKTKGIGLGLSTALSLTHALQGAISLESSPEEGTKVAFSVLTGSHEGKMEA